jgi:hypothetical protein
MLKIKSLNVLDDYKLAVVFENEEKRTFNLSPYLDKGVFQELKDKDYFKQVKNEAYFIHWPNEQDLSSDTLYLEGHK